MRCSTSPLPWCLLSSVFCLWSLVFWPHLSRAAIRADTESSYSSSSVLETAVHSRRSTHRQASPTESARFSYSSTDSSMKFLHALRREVFALHARAPLNLRPPSLLPPTLAEQRGRSRLVRHGQGCGEGCGCVLDVQVWHGDHGRKQRAGKGPLVLL